MAAAAAHATLDLLEGQVKYDGCGESLMHNAAEVGGIFHDTTQNLYGSFGARRASN